ncbi:MAG: hypothetical protein J4N89_07405, partial [Chloroflexi bacterium]|nr:hypothetical protein [Chloroflexota bacterium]
LVVLGSIYNEPGALLGIYCGGNIRLRTFGKCIGVVWRGQCPQYLQRYDGYRNIQDCTENSDLQDCGG